MATAEQALERVQKLYDRLVKRRKGISKAFRYFEGEQPLVYATDQWKQFHADRYKNFADNWCGVVARAPVDRLRIDGFRLGSSTDTLTDDERELWDDWNRNELAAQSKQGFLASTIAKRSYTLVWGSEDDEPEVTWEHPSQVIVDHAPGGRVRRAALKAWVDEDIEYATLYLPDEVWKFQRPATAVTTVDGRTSSGIIVPDTYLPSIGGWQPRQPASDDTWPLPNPLDVVPVVEWPNRPMLSMEPLSDIAGTMAMQDAINVLWSYMFAAADHASMPARVILNADIPKIPVLDEDGQVVGTRPAKLEDIAQGRLLFLPGAGPNAKIGQWDAAKLDVFGSEISQAIGHIAAQTSTPGHYLQTNEKFANLNGDALTAAEVPLATKVEDQQLHYSPAAKETAALMALVRGKKDMAASIRTADGRRFVHWKDAYTHSPSQVADAATKDKAVGMSLHTIFERRYGMTEEEIEREFDRIRAEQADPFTLLDPATRAAIKGAAGGDTDTGAGA